MKKLVLITISAWICTGIFAQSAGDGSSRHTTAKAVNEVTTVKKEEHKANLNKTLLVASWKAVGAEYIFDKSGKSLVKVDNRTCPGTWALEGKTLTIKPKKLMWKKSDPCSKTKILEVVSLSADSLVVVETTDKQELHLTRQK